MYKFQWTNKEEDYKAWDDFLSSTERGHYSQLSHWLRSYESYGFKSEVLLVKNEQDDIIGGMGLVISGFSKFKFCSCSCGPIIKPGYENAFENIITEFKTYIKKYRPICSSINFPILEDHSNTDIAPFCLNIEIDSTNFKDSHEGNKVKSVTSINGFRVVKLDYSDDADPKDVLFKGFNTNTKRNVKKALKIGLSLHFAQTHEEIKNAYELIELNAQTQGYSTRSWKDFGNTLINMVKDGSCVIPTCIYNGELKGALVVFHTGKRYTYISGGTLREETDLKVGHFLHYQMLLKSIENKYTFYDISVGGSPGVTRFKNGFGGRHVRFISQRYWVHNTFLFAVYNRLLPVLKKNKKYISRVLNASK